MLLSQDVPITGAEAPTAAATPLLAAHPTAAPAAETIAPTVVTPPAGGAGSIHQARPLAVVAARVLEGLPVQWQVCCWLTGACAEAVQPHAQYLVGIDQPRGGRLPLGALELSAC